MVSFYYSMSLSVFSYFECLLKAPGTPKKTEAVPQPELTPKYEDCFPQKPSITPLKGN